MAKDKNNPFFFEADLDTSKLRLATSKADKFYAMFAKSVSGMAGKIQTAEDKITTGFKKGLDGFKKKAESTKNLIQNLFSFRKKKTKEESKREEEKYREQQKRQGALSKWFEKEKAALDEIGVSWGSLKRLIGGAVIIGFAYKAASAFLEFDKAMRDVQLTFANQPKLMAAATDSVKSYKGYLDLTREELVAINRALGEYQVVQGNTKKAAAQYRFVVKEVIHLSKAMDVSGDSVAMMFGQFRRVYKLPHHRLRNVAASMKYIQEQTSMSGDELMSFAQGLEDVLSRMTSVTGDAKGEVIADMMAMAGAFKDLGVQPEKMASLFSESMKIHSQQGAQFLSLIVRDTGYSLEQVRKMIKEGNVETPTMMLIQQLQKEGPEWLDMNEHYLTEVTGLTYTELRNLQTASASTLKDLFANNKKEYERGRKHSEAAAKRQAKLSKVWASFKRFFENIMLAIGEVIVKVGEKLTDVLIPLFQKAVDYVTSFAKTLDGPKVGKAIKEWFVAFLGYVQSAWAWLSGPFYKALTEKVVPALKWVADKVKALVEWWGTLEDSTKSLMLGGAGMIYLFGKFGGVVGALGGKITGIVAGITAVYMGAKKIASWVDENQTKAMKGEALRKETEYSMLLGLKGTQQERIGFLKSEMTSKSGLLTASGAINDKELSRRAFQVIPMSTTEELGKGYMTAQDHKRKRDRDSMLAQWKGVLGMLANKNDVTAATKSLAAQRGTVTPAESVSTPSVAKVNVPQAVKAAQSTTKVQVTADSPTSERLLAEIRDALLRLNRGSNAHPSRSAVNEALG